MKKSAHMPTNTHAQYIYSIILSLLSGRLDTVAHLTLCIYIYIYIYTYIKNVYMMQHAQP